MTAIKMAQYAAIAQQGTHNSRVDRGMRGVCTLFSTTGALSMTARLYRQTLSMAVTVGETSPLHSSTGNLEKPGQYFISIGTARHFSFLI